MPASFDHSSLMAVAERQSGLWTRAQARSAGASYKVIRNRVRWGQWIDHGNGVLGPAGVLLSATAQLWRAHLAAGPESVVSHEAAAGLHELRTHRLGRPVVIRPHSSSTSIVDTVVHQIDDCAPHHRTVVNLLPVTTVARTIVDLAAISRRPRLELIVEEELSRRRTSLGELSVLLAEVARPGKPGVGRMATVLDRQVGSRPGRSALERLLVPILRDLGEPVSEQVELPSRGDVRGIVDAALVECRVIVEVDGRRWHDRRRDMIRDRDRDNAALAAGWATLRFMWEHVSGDAAGVLSTLRSTCAERRRLLAA